ncbi:MAG: molecular chaperone GroES [Chlamydiae bacterium SM23_39]|nr:MAG: molecular chaperone GroES [Chlamydiae bacterium SM23_39]
MTVKTNVKIKPLLDRVVAKRLESEETLKGGIIIPDTAKQKQETARVIAIGPGKKTESGKIIEIPVKIGDLILIDKYSGQEVTFDDEEYIIIKSDDIIATIEEKNRS